MVRFTLIFLSLIIIINFSKAQNVGIGESAPATKFEIKGDSGSDLLNIKDQSDVSKLYIDNSGNVGIGNTSPSELLEVNGNAYIQRLIIKSNSVSTTSDISLTANAHIETDNSISISMDSDDDETGSFISFGTNSAARDASFEELMRIAEGGEVGIGTDNPSYPLHIVNDPAGSNPLLKIEVDYDGGVSNALTLNNMYDRDIGIEFQNQGNQVWKIINDGPVSTGDKFRVQNETSTSLFTIEQGGNIGVGEDNPASTLDVNGDLRLLNGTSVNDFSTDGTLVGNSDNSIPTEQAVKTYVDDQVSGSDEWDKSSGIIYPKNASDYVLIGSTNTADAAFELNVDGTLNFLQEDGILYQPLESGAPSARYAMRFNLTNNASYPYLTNRTPNGDVVIMSGGASAGSENEHFRVNGGDGLIDIELTNADLDIGSNDINNVEFVRVNTGVYFPNMEETSYDASYQDPNHTMLFWDRNNSGTKVDGSDRATFFYWDDDDSEFAYLIDTKNMKNIELEVNSINIGGTADPGNGNLLVNGTVKSNGINETSDRRLKREIKPLCNALDLIKNLEGVSYYWRADEFPEKNLGDSKEIGVIAQQVEKYLPEVVNTDSEGYKSVQYSHLVPVLIEALKEQQEIIENKDIKMQAMQKSIKALQADMKVVKETQEMSAKK